MAYSATKRRVQMVCDRPSVEDAGSAAWGLSTPYSCISHESAQAHQENCCGKHQGKNPPNTYRAFRFLRRWAARASLRSLTLAQGVNISLSLRKEGSSTANASCVTVVTIVAVGGVHDVLLSFDEGKATAPTRWRCGDVHHLMYGSLPNGADIDPNRASGLQG